MPHSFEQICGAVARGWCDPRNSAKEMDADLATAIAKEVWLMLHPEFPVSYDAAMAREHGPDLNRER